MADQGSGERQLVVFDLADESFGVDINTVREIIRMQAITQVPDAPASVDGVINLRGGVIPVVDLRRRFGLRVSDITASSRVLVVDISGENIGVVVDAVTEVLRIPESSIEARPPIVATQQSVYIQGIAKVGDGMMILLDLDDALSSQALTHFNEKSQQAAGQAVRAAAEEPARDEDSGTMEWDAVDEATPELNIELLESTFDAVAPRASELAEFFYDRLFEQYPDVQPLFAGTDMREHQGKLIAALSTVVASLRKPEKLIPVLQGLGERHAGHGAEEAHYGAVGGVLLESLAHIPGDGWTDEAQEAWADAYDVISSVMIEAALNVDSDKEAAA